MVPGRYIVMCVLQEVSRLTTAADLELFLLNHGEQVIDALAVEVDRIERNVKVSSSHTTHIRQQD